MTAATIVLAPYGDPDPAVRRWHTERAALIVAMLHREGTPAACIHRAIDAGDYGDDADPEARARGLAASRAITACFPRAFVLLRDDGTMSSGTAADVHEWMRTHGGLRAAGTDDCLCGRWPDLGARMVAVGLGDAWVRLAVRPEVTP